LAGIFAGLGMATNPYAVYIVPVFALVKLLLDHPSKARGYRHYLPDVYDVLFFVTWIAVYIFAHPNLWANPMAGFAQWLDITLTRRRHLFGTGTHFFYAEVLLLTTLPTTMLLAVGGLATGLKQYRKQTPVLLAWFAWFLLLLSIPSGTKNVKNILQFVVPMSIWAGIGIEWLASMLARRWRKLTFEASYWVMLAGLVMIGLASTIYWWPMPQLFVLPGITIHIDDDLGIAGSEGIKPALDYIYAHSPGEAKYFIARAGRNNLLFYLPDEAVRYGTMRDYHRSDWLIVLPKSIPHENGWFTGVEPTAILKHRQIELAYLYYLPDFFAHKMADISLPLLDYDNGTRLTDVAMEQRGNLLALTIWWDEKPDTPYGFSIQLYDVHNNKVAQKDFVLSIDTKQYSNLDISMLADGKYRVSLSLDNLQTMTSVGGRMVDSDTPFESEYDIGTINLVSA